MFASSTPPDRAPPTPLEAALTERMSTLLDPLTGKDWVSTRQMTSLQVVGETAVLDMRLPYSAQSQWPVYTDLIRQHLQTDAQIKAVQVNWSTHITAHASPPGVARVPGVKNLVAIASGKGGVGKSTTAVNVALALHAEGARLVNHGIQMMSMGLLVADQAPTIWRGPMATQGLDQLLRLTRWGYIAEDDTEAVTPLDYLIVDMPPGTGDIHLSICQRAPLTAAAVVTTPQDIALLDAIKGLRMFEKMHIPVLGIIENMAVYHCPACGHEAHIFGKHGGQHMAHTHHIQLLGSLPLALKIREDADSGRPTLVSEPSGPTAALYLDIARRLAAQISLLPKDYSSKMPPVTVAG
jgi:ATP-binding protein involved in chromosome partitioning